MITPGLDRMWYYGQRHQELLAEAKRHRLVQEALKAGQPKFHNSSKILVYIAKKLTTMGARLEERYGNQPHAEVPLNQQTFPGR